MSLKGSVPLHLILIAVLGLLAYSNTFHAPFQWDEQDFIVTNPIVKDLNYFLEPSKAKELKYYKALKSRYIGYLSFALNRKLHGLDVTGYHIFNLAIHIFNSLLIYFLVILTFRTPFLSGSTLKEQSKYIALFTGLLFVSHPVQTEAVTYIFQRLASLMTFFYLLSLVAYIGSRLSTRNTSRYALYALSLISAVLAMKTKEHAFTLPLIIMLYEFLFLSGSIKRRVLRLIPLLLTLFIIPLTLIGIDKPPGEIIGSIGSETRGYEAMSREDYLFTQFRVVVTYIRLLFLPINQNLDYDYPVFHSFFNPQVLLSALLLLCIFGFAVYLLYRSRFTSPDLRVLAFGIFWFFITLSVESSIIPIPVVINEYRIYLPSVGAFSAIISGVFLLQRRLKNKKMQAATVLALVLIPLILSDATYARNGLWRSRTTLWEDVVKKSPGKARGHNNLGVAYESEGLLDKAIEHYRTALRLKPSHTKAHTNLGNAYKSKGLTDKAIEHYRIALKLTPNSAEAHNNLGVVYDSEGLTAKAIEHYRIALRLKTDYAEAHSNIAIAYGAKGLTDKAIEHYRIALRLKPDNAEAHSNIAVAYGAKGLTDKAIEHYKIALRLKPDYAGVHNNLGNAYRSKGLTDKAIEHYKTALRLKPDYAEAHKNIAVAYGAKGLIDKAIEHLQTAVRLKPDYAEAHFALGLAYLKKGIMEEARREFETALQINPDYRKAREYLDNISKL